MMKSIKGYVKGIKQKIKDEQGYLKKAIQLKRLEKYANEIDMVLTKYNKKSCDETMMVKGLRKSNAETTNRKIHQEDLEKIVAQIAKGLGLNEKMVKIMGKHHDIGHTFLGHSGEWWISNILDDYGIGCYCHNTLGARDLVFTKEVYKEIINTIKTYNPNVSAKEVEKIKKSLWLIMDGINAHNGEKPEKEYVPDIKKEEQNFIEEIKLCYTKKGYDRKITPATPEASLMRLADQISYIPLDMIDGLREGMIRDKEGNIVDILDDDYKEILVKLGVQEELINECNRNKTFLKIADRLKEIFVQDVIKNSTKKRIIMSKENMTLMNQLRNLNNEKIIDNVVLKEDQETYPTAIRTLMERYKDIILEKGLLTKLRRGNINLDEYANYQGTVDEEFIKFICNINENDFDLTTQIARSATKESIKEELTIARNCVLERKKYEDEEECGLKYDLKNARIRGYIKYYDNALQEGKLINYSPKDSASEEKKVFINIVTKRTNENYININERIALLLSAQYISNLSDHEFIQLLQETEMITEEQYKSLTRKYKDIKNLHEEKYSSKMWKKISKEQKDAGKEIEEQK